MRYHHHHYPAIYFLLHDIMTIIASRCHCSGRLPRIYIEINSREIIVSLLTCTFVVAIAQTTVLLGTKLSNARQSQWAKLCKEVLSLKWNSDKHTTMQCTPPPPFITKCNFNISPWWHGMDTVFTLPVLCGGNPWVSHEKLHDWF